MEYCKLLNGEFKPCLKSELIKGDKYKQVSSGGSILISFYGGVESSVNDSISRREFWQRVGDAVYASLLSAAESDNLLKARIDIINGDNNIWLESPEYKLWFSDLVSSGYISQPEYDFIFNLRGY